MNERIEQLLEQIQVNEQIKRLAEQAGCTIDRLGYGEGNLEKFAEIIVAECIDVVLDSDPSPKMIAHEPYRTIMNNIQEHFGVEV